MPAVAGGRVAPCRRRAAVVDFRLLPDQRCRAAASRLAAGLAENVAAHGQHERHRRCPAGRSRAGRAADRGGGGLQQQPGRGGAGIRQGGRRLRARRPVHRGARAFPHRYRRLRRYPVAGHHAARAHRRAQGLRPHLFSRQQRRDRTDGRGAAQYRDLPPAGAAHGFHRPVFRRQRRGHRRAGDPAGRCARRRHQLGVTQGTGLAEAGTGAGTVRRRRLSHRLGQVPVLFRADGARRLRPAA
ncbi:hypothetical protein D9M72_531830 [compost metagenome]